MHDHGGICIPLPKWYHFNMNREEIISKLQAILPEVKEKYHVKSMGIFGSVARGDDTETSDVDILVEYDIVPGFFGFIQLEKFLSDELGGRKVDLATRKALKEVIKDDILKETIYV